MVLRTWSGSDLLYAVARAFPPRVGAALIFTLFAWPLCAQSSADSGAATSSQQQVSSTRRPSREPGVDRPVIDATTLVRERGVRNLADLLAGRIAGLLVVPGSGLTGMGSRIRLRGAQTLVSDPGPLVLMDGIRVDASEDDFQPSSQGALVPGPLRLDDIDLADIDSIEVLPGPAMAAAYGPGAASGVLQIHTKQGRPGRPRWDAYAQGVVGSEPASWPTNFGGVDLDNPDSAYRHGACSLDAEAAGRCMQDYVQRFNPFEQRSPFRTALRRRYGLSVSGGSGWGDYRLAGAFEGDGGPYSSSVATPDPNYYRRVSFRASGAVRPRSTVEIAARGGYVSSDLRLPTNAPLLETMFGTSDSTNFQWSPVFRDKGTQAVERPFGVVEARWRPRPWLTLRGLAGEDKVDLRDRAVSPRVSPDTTQTFLAEAHRQALHRTLELGGSAAMTPSSALRLRTTVGVQHLRNEVNGAWTAGLEGAACGVCSSTWLSEREQSLGYYVEEGLDVRERLFLTGALRHDHFEDTPRSTTYPSVSVSWVAHAADSGRVSLLRLRAAYGSAGLAVPAFLAFEIVPIGTALPPLEPEKTRSFELGADVGLIGGRLGGSLTYYDMRSDVMRFASLSVPSGFVQTYVSGSVVSNRGVEAAVTGKLLTGPRVGWDVTLSLWGNRNRLEKLAGPPLGFGFGGAQRLVPGYPVGGYWALPIRSYGDVNGNGIIEPSEVTLGSERVWAGTPYPTQGAALTTGVTLARRLRLSTTLEYRGGQTLFNETAWARCLYPAVCREANDRSTPPVDQARVASGYALTTAYFEDAHYVKLRELALSFDAPRGVTITLVGRNLTTWTGYSGLDPEAGSYGTLAPGRPRAVADLATLPVPRSWTLRIDLAY